MNEGREPRRVNHRQAQQRLSALTWTQATSERRATGSIIILLLITNCCYLLLLAAACWYFCFFTVVQERTVMKHNCTAVSRRIRAFPPHDSCWYLYCSTVPPPPPCPLNNGAPAGDSWSYSHSSSIEFSHRQTRLISLPGMFLFVVILDLTVRWQGGDTEYALAGLPISLVHGGYSLWPRRRSRETALLFSESWWHLTMWDSRPSLFMIIPNTNAILIIRKRTNYLFLR